MLKFIPVRSSYKFTSISMLAVLFALVLNLNLVSNAFAREPIVNPSFSTTDALGNVSCTLDGWTSQGDVSVVDGRDEGLAYADQCVAKTYQNRDGSSSLAQGFVVPADSPYLHFYVWGKYSMGFNKITNPTFLSQTITLYDASDRVIVSNSKNVNNPGMMGLFKYNLNAYAGQQVKLVVTVQLDSRNPSSPIWSTLYIDQLQFLTYALHPGDGTYAW